MRSGKDILGLWHPDGSPILPKSVCPVCNYGMDAATGLGERSTPKPGDYSVCLNCGELLQFNEILVLKPLPADSKIDAENKALLDRASQQIKQRGRIR